MIVQVPINISNLPIASKVINTGDVGGSPDDDTNTSRPGIISAVNFNKPAQTPDNKSKTSIAEGTLSTEWEHFHNDIFNNTSSLSNRGLNVPIPLLRNPDFNILSANNYDPVTPLEGSDYEVVGNWFLVNGGGTNDYTITPTAWNSTDNSPTGSLNYINVDITTQDSPLYFYNVNYSTDSPQQFNGAAKYNGQIVTMSMVYRNNTDNEIQCQFTTDTPGYGLTHSAQFTLKNTRNFIAARLLFPNFDGTSLTPPYLTQFRFNISNIFETAANFDIIYLKTEISNVATPLQIDHTLEQLICNALT